MAADHPWHRAVQEQEDPMLALTRIEQGLANLTRAVMEMKMSFKEDLERVQAQTSRIDGLYPSILQALQGTVEAVRSQADEIDSAAASSALREVADTLQAKADGIAQAILARTNVSPQQAQNPISTAEVPVTEPAQQPAQPQEVPPAQSQGEGQEFQEQVKTGQQQVEQPGQPDSGSVAPGTQEPQR